MESIIKDKLQLYRRPGQKIAFGVETWVMAVYPRRGIHQTWEAWKMENEVL